MFFRSALLCLCLIINIINCQQSYAGDFCVLRRTGENGSCQLLKDCAPAITDLQQGKVPQTCSFDGTAPIVCCVTKNSPPPTTTTTTTRTTAGGVINRNPGAVGQRSLQKCTEYAKYVYTNYTPPTAFLGPDVVKRRDDCGFKGVKLIVGGTKAKTKEFPHMALIGYDTTDGAKAYVCGGALISENFVLTAGHCLRPRDYSEAKYVRVGDLNINRNDDLADPQELNIIEIIKHPDYVPPSQYNDIGLLKLERNVRFNPFVRPICLNIKKIAETRQCIATGWGNIEYLGPSSDDLLKVTLDLIEFQKCSQTYQPNKKLRDGLKDASQMCAGSEEAKDACQGDSGGPLQIYHANEYCMYTLIGVTSFGKACGVAPGVYTRVSNYIEWIENTVWP